METLKQLRAANVKRQQTEAARFEASRQLDLIANLQREKEILIQRLEGLVKGEPLRNGNENENPDLLESRQMLATLKEKLLAHKIFGPCGQTVLDINDRMLVVNFNAIWKNLTHSFVLKILLIDGKIKVSGTDIPYFVEVPALLDNYSIVDLPDRMDIIGNRISAFVRRKREVQYVEEEFRGDLKSISYDQACTSIYLKIDCPGNGNEELTISLWYASVEDVFPHSVDFTRGARLKFKMKKTVHDHVVSLFKEQLLSKAFPDAVDRLAGRPRRKRRTSTEEEEGQEGDKTNVGVGRKSEEEDMA